MSLIQRGWPSVLGLMVATSAVVLPYVQRSANQHMNEGPLFAVLYVAMGAAVAVGWALGGARSVPAVTFVLGCGLWAWRFTAIGCLGCAAGG